MTFPSIGHRDWTPRKDRRKRQLPGARLNPCGYLDRAAPDGGNVTVAERFFNGLAGPQACRPAAIGQAALLPTATPWSEQHLSAADSLGIMGKGPDKGKQPDKDKQPDKGQEPDKAKQPDKPKGP
jgi:hypothetical protein